MADVCDVGGGLDYFLPREVKLRRRVVSRQREQSTRKWQDVERTQILTDSKFVCTPVHLMGSSRVILDFQDFCFFLLHQILDFQNIGIGEFLNISLCRFPFVV